jgi:hypothetical protein
MKEPSAKQIIVEECLRCKPIHHIDVINDEGKGFLEWICSGLMIHNSKKPLNDHEKYNRIRLCYRRGFGNKIDITELTEYEAACLAESLNAVLATSLQRLQDRMIPK